MFTDAQFTLLMISCVTAVITTLAYWKHDRFLLAIAGVGLVTLGFLFIDTNKVIAGALYALWVYSWREALVRR